jgi:hypothetical protein
MDFSHAMDLRGTPAHACLCGSGDFFIQARFEDYELSMYYLDMQCVDCGSLLTAPTPLDRQELE